MTKMDKEPNTENDKPILHSGAFILILKLALINNDYSLFTKLYDEEVA